MEVLTASRCWTGTRGCSRCIPAAAWMATELPLLQIPNFLSDEEADEVIRLGHEELQAQHGGRWEREVAYGTAFFHYHQSNMSHVLVELEDRIARTTMIGPHPDELPLMFTRQVSCAHEAQQRQALTRVLRFQERL